MLLLTPSMASCISSNSREEHEEEKCPSLITQSSFVPELLPDEVKLPVDPEIREAIFSGFAQVVSSKSTQITFSSYPQLLNTVAPGQKWHSSPDRNLCITQTVGFGGSSQLLQSQLRENNRNHHLLKYLQRSYLHDDNQPKIQRDSLTSYWL